MLATGVGIAASGTILAPLFTGSIAGSHWNPAQTAQFREAITIAGLTLALIAAALVIFGMVRSRRGPAPQTPNPPVPRSGF